MSVDITGWGKLDSDLADSIAKSLDDKFLQLQLPDYIKSVRVTSFQFGKKAPKIEIKDITDPFPEFYEEDYFPHSGEESIVENIEPSLSPRNSRHVTQPERRDTESLSTTSSQPPPYTEELLNQNRTSSNSTTTGTPHPLQTSSLSFLQSAFPPHIIHGYPSPLAIPNMSNPFSTGIWNGINHPITSTPDRNLFSSVSMSSLNESRLHASNGHNSDPRTPSSSPIGARRSISMPEQYSATAMLREPQDDDIQMLASIDYEGDIRLGIKAELLLNYPSSSFVALPIHLNLTGFSFNGNAILASIGEKVHFCFQDQEGEDLLKSVSIESELGETTQGVLKNVKTVESFILEELRRILDDEFVFPSFWTFAR